MGRYMSCGVIRLVSAEVELTSVYSSALFSVSPHFYTQSRRLSSLARR